MQRVTCELVRRRLGAFHDGELTLEDQVTIQGHVAVCRGCVHALERLQTIGKGLRLAASVDITAPGHTDGLRDGVISRLAAEDAETLGMRVRRMFDDMHLVWAGLAATAASATCLLIVSGLVHFAAAQRTDDSLFGIMRAMASASATVHAAGLERPIQLPRVSPTAAMPLFLGETGPFGGDDLFALTAVVTREGRLTDLELLLSGGRDEERVLQLLLAVSAAHFEPARLAGSPVSVNLVWLLAHTTVQAPKLPRPEAALTVVGGRLV